MRRSRGSRRFVEAADPLGPSSSSSPAGRFGGRLGPELARSGQVRFITRPRRRPRETCLDITRFHHEGQAREGSNRTKAQMSNELESDRAMVVNLELLEFESMVLVLRTNL
jgi:hypothetical protein